MPATPPGSVSKYVTWITEVETIKRQTMLYTLYGWTPKSVSACLDCNPGYTPALFFLWLSNAAAMRYAACSATNLICLLSFLLFAFASKMAAASLVLCRPLCFLIAKFKHSAAKPLKSAVCDFYCVEDLAEAKRVLLRDIDNIRLEINLPHIGYRRGEKETTELLTLLTISLPYCRAWTRI